MTSTLSQASDEASGEVSGDHGHEEHGDYRMFGLATFLVADAMTFAGFFAAYLTFKAVNPLPAGAIFELELPLPILNTVLLLVSSATFHKAGQAIRQGDHGRCRRWLLISAGLGIAFLVSQMVEYFTAIRTRRQPLRQHVLCRNRLPRTACDSRRTDDSHRVVAGQTGGRPHHG